VNGYTAYQIYLSLKLHFTNDSYDATKYGFKTSSKESTFSRRKDRFFFERIGRKYKETDIVIDYFTANFLVGVKWIGDMREENYSKYEKRMQSLSYEFEKDLRTLSEQSDSFDQICTTTIPLDCLLADEISAETIAIIDLLVNNLKRLKKDISDPLGMYTEQIENILKYKLLLSRRNIPAEKLAKTVRKVFTK
jgi:hypothetical protein|tara:strand:- start:1373 stop:1951 length:579 start_codon:yes stop_codon:yes gene_type:complete